MSARDVIAAEFGRMHQSVCYPTASDGEKEWAGDSILSALTAAGWTLAPPGSRVVPEGGVDRETVLKCIALIEQSWKPVGAGDGQTFVVGCGGGTAALRALAEAKP